MPIIPLVGLAASFLPDLIKYLAGDTAGVVSGHVVDAVKAVTGTDDPAAAAAVLAGDPATATQLRIRLAEIAVQAEGQRLQAEKDEREAANANTASARAQTLALTQAGSSQSWAPSVISTVVVVGFFGCVFLLFGAERTWDERTANLLNIMFGALIPGFGTVLNYWLGSSAGSKRAGDANREIALRSTGPAQSGSTNIATTGTVIAPAQPGSEADTLNGDSLRRGPTLG